MKIAIVLICIFMGLRADFLGNVYDELKELNLSKVQQNTLKNIIKEHHIFLRQWYIDSKTNNDAIMMSFSNSSLDEDSQDLIDSLELANLRFKASQDFLIQVYNILDNQQRAKFGQKIKKDSKIPQFEEKLPKTEFDSDLFYEKGFKRQNER